MKSTQHIRSSRWARGEFTPSKAKSKADLASLKPPANSASIAGDVLTLLISVGASFVIKVVGELPLPAIIMAPLLPLLIILRFKRLVRLRMRTVLILLALWLFSQVLTDALRGTAMSDWARMDARIALMFLSLLSLAILVGRNLRRHIIFFSGYALGAILQTPIQPNVYAEGSPWKFGYATGVTLLVVLISCYFYARRRFGVVILLLAAICAIHLLMDYRSAVLFVCITLVLVAPVIPERIGRLRILPPADSISRAGVLIGLTLIGGWGAVRIVEYSASLGLLGESAYRKNQDEANVKGGILLGGRPEILVSARAVWDSPILGHGSWAKDSKYSEMLIALEEEYGFNINDRTSTTLDPSQIPTHSHLMDAWVDAGILGAVFWCYILSIAARACIRAVVMRPPLAPIYVFTLISFLWAILFSPPGGTNVIPEMFVVIVSLDLLETLPHTVSESSLCLAPSYPRWGRIKRLDSRSWSR